MLVAWIDFAIGYKTPALPEDSAREKRTSLVHGDLPGTG
jgi:hypothetical protein